jgi:hypothetical protein
MGLWQDHHMQTLEIWPKWLKIWPKHENFFKIWHMLYFSILNDYEKYGKSLKNMAMWQPWALVI